MSIEVGGEYEACPSPAPPASVLMAADPLKHKIFLHLRLTLIAHLVETGKGASNTQGWDWLLYDLLYVHPDVFVKSLLAEITQWPS